MYLHKPKLFIILFLTSLLLLNCSLLSNQPEQTPEEVVTTFMTALAEQRLDDVENLLSPGCRQRYLSDCKVDTLAECGQILHQKLGQLTYQIKESDVKEKSAIVSVRAVRANNPIPACINYTLELQSGQWVITGHQSRICQ